VLFTEGVFFPFCAIVLLAYWKAANGTVRKWILLIASYVFYAFWDWRFLGLIILSTLIDYALASRIAVTEKYVARRLLIASLVVNLGVLGFFKYFNFFSASLVSLASALGWQLDRVTIEIALPIGISFYTFQSLSYTIDVYRKELEPARSLLDFAFCISFFPHLVAGPIIRASDMLKQLAEKRTSRHLDLIWSCNLFAIGFFKKACVADNLAPLADAFFTAPNRFSSSDAWLGLAAYTVQIYCDFSGYSDMAIAVAGLFGYTLRSNFGAPYLATSITDFWRRWHTSLSTWLRDYLYIPMGGGRTSTLRSYQNLMVTMLLGGLWHGASWNFVLWGGMHGTALVFHKEWMRRFGEVAPALIGWILTVIWVGLAWIPFRAPGLVEARGVLSSMFGSGNGSLHLSTDNGVGWALVLTALLIGHWFAQRPRTSPSPLLGNWRWGLAYGACWAVLLAIRRIGYVPFVYFQF
jgi:alginate O-acetyltransferase complex protein AlgI